MSDALLSALKRRFAAQAELLPSLLPALVSGEPTPFLVRYRPDALFGAPEAAFRKLRQAAREERETSRRRQSVRRALELAGALTEDLGKLLDDASDPAVLEDIARPVRAAKAAEGEGKPAEDPMRPVARQVLLGETAAKPAVDIAAEPAGQPAGDIAAEAAGEPTGQPAGEPAAEPAGQTVDQPVDAPVGQPALEPAADAATQLAELLAPYCGADGAPPTADDQRARLVRLVADLIGDDPLPRRAVRAAARRTGELQLSLEGRKEAKAVYKPFADVTKPFSKIPSRMLLLLRRGQKAGAVRAKLILSDEEKAALLAGPLAPREGHPYADLVKEAAADALDRVLVPAAMNEVLKEKKRAAEKALLPLFTQALREKLLSPAAGPVAVVAVVPGATGTCRIAVVDAQGRAGATVAVHPLPPRNETEAAVKVFVDTVRESGAKIVAVAASGRARALREWVMATLAANLDLGAVPVLVNESAAVAWSESESGKAAEPELPATVRAALSLGRLVQDPLVEAVRYDLCEIPLGPNQGDVDQGELRRRLDEMAEACVAYVGVDVNSAPAVLLARVPGLDAASALRIVAWRDANGPFATRADVRKVEGLEEQAWQYAAGFLRIKGGVDPLDATGVHPTGATAVHAIAVKLAVEPAALIGRADLLAPLDPKEFASEVLTEGDVRSVLEELARPTGDPRGGFVAPAFNPGVGRTKDLVADMQIDGVITSLSKFGAFVDVGVGQDGLVHVSELAHHFVRDPADAVAVGQRVRVKVVAVDNAKRRISLSIKALLPVPERPPEPAPGEGQQFGGRRDGGGAQGAMGGPRRPQRPRPEGSPAGGGPHEGRGGERRGPGGFVPERPGTAPRRAQRRGGFGGGKPAGGAPDAEIDLSRDGGTGSFGNLTGGRGGGRGGGGGGGGGGRGFDRPERDDAPQRRRDGPRDLDPFQQQLAALKARLGIGQEPNAPAVSEPPQATDPAGDGDRPTA